MNLQAILSECVSDENLNLQINNSGSQISVVINRPVAQTDINYESIAEVLLAKLRSLKISNIKSLKVYGRPNNTKQIEWQSSYPLVYPESTPTKSISTTVSSIKSDITKSKFQTYLEQFSYYSNVISAASLLGLLLLLGFNTLAGQKTQAIVWEYRIESIPDLSFTASMNALGAEGWELTSARRAQDSTTDTFAYECIFKRVKR